MTVTVYAPAKINLSLHVGPVRSDGFHQLDTLYCAVSLYDELTVAHAGSDVDLRVTGEGASFLPTSHKNLVVRAARLLAKHTGVDPRIRVRLHKKIPVAAGLAGGSTDAAAALVACDQLWGTNISSSKLAELAAQLGSDVPFPLFGGVAIGHGRGELIEPLLGSLLQRHWVLAAATFGLSTPKVFAELDRLRAIGLAPAPEPPHHPNSVEGALNAPLHNDLQEAAFALAPSLRETMALGLQAGATDAIVSGSGPTLIFSVANTVGAKQVIQAVRRARSCRWACAVHGPVAGMLSE